MAKPPREDTSPPELGPQAVLARWDAHLREKRRDTHRNLRPGATAEAMARFRKAIGVELPESFYALYARHDGTKDDWEGFASDLGWLRLARVLAGKRLMDRLARDDAFDRWLPGEWWSPAWVPFLDDHGYDLVCIDTAGAFGGTPGQILEWSKDDPTRRVLHASFADWVTTQVELLAAAQPDEDGDLEAWFESDAAEALHARLNPGYPWSARARERAEATRRK